MAKVKTGDNVAYTPTKAESAIPAVDGIVIGVVEAVEDKSIVIKTNDASFNVSNNPRRFKKLPVAVTVATPEVVAKPEVKADAVPTKVSKPGSKKAVKTSTPRPGSKKYRAIQIYQEVNGNKTTDLDRTTVKARLEAELQLGSQGSSTYYQNIKSRQNGWWF